MKVENARGFFDEPDRLAKLSEQVPDSKTTWHFLERLSGVGGVERLLVHKGSIMDASFVEAPRQRNTREENAEINAGNTPQVWPSPPNKLR